MRVFLLLFHQDISYSEMINLKHLKLKPSDKSNKSQLVYTSKDCNKKENLTMMSWKSPLSTVSLLLARKLGVTINRVSSLFSIHYKQPSLPAILPVWKFSSLCSLSVERSYLCRQIGSLAPLLVLVLLGLETCQKRLCIQVSFIYFDVDIFSSVA